MVRGRVFILLSLFAALGEASAWARQDSILGSRYTSARSAGMGDTGFGFLSDVAGGLFYNPAALARAPGFVIEPLNIALQVSHNYITNLNFNFAGNTALNFYNVMNLAGYQTPTYQGIGGQVLPSLGWRFVSFGILLSSETGQMLTAGSLRYRTTYQLIPTIGAGFRIADGVLKLGYSFQWVNSVVANVTGGSAAGAAYNANARQGSGFSQNAGATITFPMAFLPQIHFVVRNILGAPYIPFSILPLANGSIGVPTTDPMSMDLSIGIQPKFGMGSSLQVVLAWRDITDASAVPFLAHLAAGAEFLIKDTVFIRAGLSGGRPSAGFGIKTKRSEFNFAWYCEEIGGGYLTQGDVRYMLQYQFHL